VVTHRLTVELESSTAQVDKLKVKGAKDKAREAAKSVAESQALYDAVYDQIPADVAAEAVEHIKTIREAQAAVDAANAALVSAFPRRSTCRSRKPPVPPTTRP